MGAPNDFYITLPSNVPSKFHENKTSHFFTELPQPIELNKENWEVALVEIDYPRSWYNVQQKACKVTLSKFIHDDSTVMYKQHIILKHGYYIEKREILREIKESKNPIFETTIMYDDVSRKTNIKLAQRESIAISKSLSNMIGFLEPVKENHWSFNTFKVQNTDYKTVLINDETIIEPEDVLQPLKAKKISAQKAFDLSSGLNSIYVYSNVIEDCVVGNAVVPLLRTVLVSGNYGDLVQKIFIHPHYLPISQNRINDIEISLRDDQGSLIPFEFGKVLIKLHFRKKRILI